MVENPMYELMAIYALRQCYEHKSPRVKTFLEWLHLDLYDFSSINLRTILKDMEENKDFASGREMFARFIREEIEFILRFRNEEKNKIEIDNFVEKEYMIIYALRYCYKHKLPQVKNLLELLNSDLYPYSFSTINLKTILKDMGNNEDFLNGYLDTVKQVKLYINKIIKYREYSEVHGF